MNNKIIAIFYITMFLFSCAKKGYLETFNETADGWLNRPPTDEFDYSDYNKEPENIPIVFIQDEKLFEAHDKLVNGFYIELTNEEYTYFTGKIKDDENNAYLIRSVNYSFNESGYHIYKNDKKNLLIWHGTLGTGKWKGCQKWPIIILYDDIINVVYTDYSFHR